MINQYAKQKEDFFREKEHHFYKEAYVESLLQDDELTNEEAAFMRGYISS
ncbi:MAG: hypothetical protein ACOCQQ_02265 [Candidatus Nanoarchaeia archaeon]